MIDLLVADSDTFWLNLVNISLAAVVIGAALALALAVVLDVIGTARSRFKASCY